MQVVTVAQELKHANTVITSNGAVPGIWLRNTNMHPQKTAKRSEIRKPLTFVFIGPFVFIHFFCFSSLNSSALL